VQQGQSVQLVQAVQ
jgi:hypothetical protein